MLLGQYFSLRLSTWILHFPAALINHLKLYFWYGTDNYYTEIHSIYWYLNIYLIIEIESFAFFISKILSFSSSIVLLLDEFNQMYLLIEECQAQLFEKFLSSVCSTKENKQKKKSKCKIIQKQSILNNELNS